VVVNDLAFGELRDGIQNLVEIRHAQRPFTERQLGFLSSLHSFPSVVFGRYVASLRSLSPDTKPVALGDSRDTCILGGVNTLANIRVQVSSDYSSRRRLLIQTPLA